MNALLRIGCAAVMLWTCGIAPGAAQQPAPPPRDIDPNTLASAGLQITRLIDGNRAPKAVPAPVRTVVGGDGRCLSIAAASIVAKVTRDRIMCALALEHPVYAWESNKGYNTPSHRAGLTRHGPCRHHRRSFVTVAKMLIPQPVTLL